MTLDEIRVAVRGITKSWAEDEDTLLPSDNVLLDMFINWACEDVVLDLVEYMPEDFLTYEDISLVADDNDYDLTAEWISIWAMQKKVTDENYILIPYAPVADRGDYVGETAEDPKGWFLKGTTIIFWPTPSTAKTDYIRCWIIAPEVEAMTADARTFTVDSSNKYIDVYKVEGYGGTDQTATLTVGTYSGDDLATEIKTQLDATGGASHTFTITYTSSSGKFTIAADADFNITWKTGTHGSDNADDNISSLIGFADSADDGSAATYTSDSETPEGTIEPGYIPRMAHKLIVLDAAMLVCYMNDGDVGKIAALYRFQKDRIIDSLTNRVQQQPQFLKPSVFSRMTGDRRDKAFYDKGSPFER